MNTNYLFDHRKHVAEKGEETLRMTQNEKVGVSIKIVHDEGGNSKQVKVFLTNEKRP